jgi:hypothetical protein
MNFVLLCGRKSRRDFEIAIRKTENVTLLGTECSIDRNFLEKILENYNPHGVVIERGVKIAGDFTAEDVAVTLKTNRPAMRIIFLYGDIPERQDFEKTAQTLIALGIYDIVPHLTNCGNAYKKF